VKPAPFQYHAPRTLEETIEVTDYYDPPLVTMANATHVAEVAVDARTGRVEIERYAVVHDCGRVINPMIVEGQVHGGAAQGIGEAVLEAMVYGEDGQCQTATLVDYLLPTTADMPPMIIEHIESPSIDAAGGFKGIGEGGVIGERNRVIANGEAVHHGRRED
jgi:aerobic carbon-monoxide dehydrogenase large subunit